MTCSIPNLKYITICDIIKLIKYTWCNVTPGRGGTMYPRQRMNNMTYRTEKQKALRGIGKCYHLLAMNTAINLITRHGTLVIAEVKRYEHSTYTAPPIDPLPKWLDGKSYEQTYRNVNELPVRQYRTIALFKEIASITIGANQTTNWFLAEFGKELTKRMPSYIVTVERSIAHSRKVRSSDSLYFDVRKDKKFKG
jgi:hypothetical protein